MARIRSLKPEAFQSESLGRCDVTAERTFWGLSTQVDDRGRIGHKPVVLNATLWAYRPTHTPDDLAQELTQLAGEGLVCVYIGCDGREYLHLVTWDEHQKIDRPSKSRLPLCPEHTMNLATSEDDYCGRHEGPCPPGVARRILDAPSRDTREVSMQDLGSRTVDHGSRTGRDSSSEIADEIPHDEITLRDDVELICTHLADRVEANGANRPNVTKRWRTSARLMLDVDGRTLDQVIRAIDWCQTDEFWRGNVLSVPKLREKYEALRHAAQRSQGRPGDRQINNLQDAMAWAQEHDATHAHQSTHPAIGA